MKKTTKLLDRLADAYEDLRDAEDELKHTDHLFIANQLSNLVLQVYSIIQREQP